MKKILELWESLSKPTKVFFYLAVSTILSEVLVELGNLDRTFIVRVSAQLINLVLVVLETGVTGIKTRLKK